jgi:hypothetical protein
VKAVQVERRIAADPTSIALLLAGPSGVALWPGVQEVAEAATGRHRVVADVPDRGTIVADVAAEPPTRTPTSFFVQFSFVAADVPASTGELRLDHDPVSVEAMPTTRASLSIRYDGPAPDRLRRLATEFLANLAAAAEERSRAA